MKNLIKIIGLCLLISACTTILPYERQYISDEEMQLDTDAGKEFNNYVNSIREGATPAGSGKSSGGCGCN